MNAFTNAKLPSPVWTYEPDGFQTGSNCWELHKALYGLKTSPLLWYKDFTATLESLGLWPVLDVPCLWMNDRIFVFFYVDDIMTLAKPGHASALEDFEKKLEKRYEITNFQDRENHTFCGITSYRNREDGQLWLSQRDYIDQIYHKFVPPTKMAWSKAPSTPLPLDELVPHNEVKNDDNCQRYAQIVGSIGWCATGTRPDTAKAHSKLAQFLTNPGPWHLAAAYQCLAYLYHTRDQALHYSADLTDDHVDLRVTEEPDFFAATDASYADHRASRKSSGGYILYLFGGPIDWKATLQRCVTKSTTEAELISASTGATELIWWNRVFKELRLEFDHERILFCDNQQTLRLLTSEAPLLKTSLRHVDIHHHWLREQTMDGTIKPVYIETKAQPADGLTKLLPRQRHEDWLKLLQLQPLPKTQEQTATTPSQSQ